MRVKWAGFGITGHSPVAAERRMLVDCGLHASVSYPRHPAPIRTFAYRPIRPLSYTSLRMIASPA